MNLLAGFIISWLPYLCVCLYRAFVRDSNLSPMMATIPACFGKFSLAWPALLSLTGFNEIRKKRSPDGLSLSVVFSKKTTFVSFNFYFIFYIFN